MAKCGKKCEVFSRVVGYHRPIQNWNHGKKLEFSDRTEFQENVCFQNDKMSSEGLDFEKKCC